MQRSQGTNKWNKKEGKTRQSLSTSSESRKLQLRMFIPTVTDPNPYQGKLLLWFGLNNFGAVLDINKSLHLLKHWLSRHMSMRVQHLLTSAIGSVAPLRSSLASWHQYMPLQSSETSTFVRKAESLVRAMSCFVTVAKIYRRLGHHKHGRTMIDWNKPEEGGLTQ